LFLPNPSNSLVPFGSCFLQHFCSPPLFYSLLNPSLAHVLIHSLIADSSCVNLITRVRPNSTLHCIPPADSSTPHRQAP
jgi:hypothetical protein